MKTVLTLIAILICIVVKSQPYKKDTDFTLLGILQVESRDGKILVGNDTTCIGVLQIRRILVDDANRIIKLCRLKNKLFTHDDRYNRKRSIELYYIIQRYYNPDYNFKRAVNLWCSGPNTIETKGKEDYLNKVKKEIMKLVITHASESHRNMVIQYINNVIKVKHSVVEITTRNIRNNIQIIDSANTLNIVCSPSLVNIPKNIGNLIESLI